MTGLLVDVQQVGKMYKLFDEPIDRLKHTLFWRFGRSYGKDFWALKNVSLSVEEGDAVGILGRNGSGKSTLLQIIAGVIQPSEGNVTVRGRISALLELGSGFNPEYSGRENIFLSGAILGISHEEMEARYDEIQQFADIGEFIDQPVKLYSSGMFARLAFAVAISIEPDILIVDEILAVGDYGFQQKCISKMRKMRDNGLTLLFVSHSPNTIKDVCNKGLFLIDGQPVYWGGAEQAANEYFRYIRVLANEEALQNRVELSSPHPFETNIPGKLRYGTGHVQIDQVEIFNSNGNPQRSFVLGDEIDLQVTIKSFIDISGLSVSFLVRDMTGSDLLGTTTFDEHCILPELHVGQKVILSFRFINNLAPGNYGISVAITKVTKRDYSDNVLFDQVDACANFIVMVNPERPVHYKIYSPITISVLSNDKNFATK